MLVSDNKYANAAMLLVQELLKEHHKPICTYASLMFNAACIYFAEKYCDERAFTSVVTVKKTDTNIAFCGDGICLAAVVLHRDLDGHFNVLTADFGDYRNVYPPKYEIKRYQLGDESKHEGWTGVMDTYQNEVKKIIKQY